MTATPHRLSLHQRSLIRLTVFGCCLILTLPAANAQPSRSSRRDADPPSEKSLELRLEKAEEALVDEYKSVVVEFYNQGNKEKAMDMLRRLKTLNPKLTGLDDRIKSISEELMQENSNTIKIDTRKSWQFIGDVAAERPFRLAARGEYKLTVTTVVGIDGMVVDKENKDYLPTAPLGCLMGVIVVDGKPGRPFPLKSEMEHTPKKSGKFFVKVNVPEGARCTGNLDMLVSGYIQSAKTGR